ncbi:MAG: hypothetical protein JWM28_266 [Chitinophagaceae bacterium]|nr:hypothetical protein [Chitinophagaceae bacterium]
MKKIIAATLLLPLLLLLNGCLTTLHPIFTVKDLVGDGRLAGSWKKTNDGSITTYRKAAKEHLKQFSETLQQNADRVYEVTVKSGNDNPESVYFAFLVKLGKYYYLDYYPAGGKKRETADAFFKAHFIPMHGIYRIDFSSAGSFEIKQLDAGYLEKLIKNKQIRIQHAKLDDGGYFITAPTEQLQQYLIKYSDVPEAYGNNNPSFYTKIN